MIPGVPAIAWINAANGCGVSMTAAPVMGIVKPIIAIAVSCIYIKFALKRAQARARPTRTSLPARPRWPTSRSGVFMALLPLCC